MYLSVAGCFRYTLFFDALDCSDLALSLLFECRAV